LGPRSAREAETAAFCPPELTVRPLDRLVKLSETPLSVDNRGDHGHKGCERCDDCGDCKGDFHQLVDRLDGEDPSDTLRLNHPL
jgi:hypothetical protein